MANAQYNTLFPSVPREAPATDKDGHFTSLWELFFGDLSQSLQSNFKNEGIVFPPLSADDLTVIQNLYTPYIGQPYNTMLMNLPDISGQTVFDSTNRVPKQFIIIFNTDPIPLVTFAKWYAFSLVAYP